MCLFRAGVGDRGDNVLGAQCLKILTVTEPLRVQRARESRGRPGGRTPVPAVFLHSEGQSEVVVWRDAAEARGFGRAREDGLERPRAILPHKSVTASQTQFVYG